MEEQEASQDGQDDELEPNLRKLTAPGNISAYAKLNFSSFSFYIQTLEIFLGRRSSKRDLVDVHLGKSKGISKRHARMFYNFASSAFELDVLGRNGIFVNGDFVEQGTTISLQDDTKLQIDGISFSFHLPSEPTLPPAPILEKPPHSYTSLILQALQTAPRLTLHEIYNVIQDQHGYYKSCPSGWQASVRHNLSLSKQFKKIPREKDEKGKGFFWTIDTAYTPPSSQKPTNSSTSKAASATPSSTKETKTKNSKPLENILNILSGKSTSGMNSATMKALEVLKAQIAAQMSGASQEMITNAVAIALAKEVKRLESLNRAVQSATPEEGRPNDSTQKPSAASNGDGTLLKRKAEQLST